MKNIICLLTMICLASSPEVIAQEDKTIEPVVREIREADAKGLAALFNSTVELWLPDHESTCSSSQGEMIMKDFFKKYPPDSFTVVKEGSTDLLSRFVICEYLSGERKYQVFLYLKQEKGKYLVQKIKFEVKP